MSQTQITRSNHFVQQAYLKRWSTDGVHVWEYALLAPHANFPEWRHAPIESSARRRDLYTSVENGEDSDRFENWINQKFETPATAALTKITEDQPLTKDDWERVAFYVAAQDLRTPASYLEQKKRWEETLPELLDNTLERVAKKITNAAKRGKSVKSKRNPESEFFPLRIQFEPEPDEDLVQICAEVTPGRQMWLHSMRLLLSKTARVLTLHKWSIMKPGPGFEWFTSDHPVVRLNYYGPDNYDFKGGWGNRGTEILLPLSPTHLLYTKVGFEAQPYIALTAEKTFELQRLLAKRAHRSIFARKPSSKVKWFRPRHVDANAFKAEQKVWDSWHAEQSAVERR